MMNKYPKHATREYWVSQIEERQQIIDKITALHKRDLSSPESCMCGLTYPCITTRIIGKNGKDW